MVAISKGNRWADLSKEANTVLLCLNSYDKEFFAAEAIKLAGFGIHMLTKQQPSIDQAALIDEVAHGLYVWFEDGDQGPELLAYFKYELTTALKRV